MKAKTDLEKLRAAFDALGIQYEEKSFKITTGIVLTADDKTIAGRPGNFCEFKFDKESNDSLRSCGIYVRIAPVEGLKAAQERADRFAAPLRKTKA